jgi:signal transduction histidine kinase
MKSRLAKWSAIATGVLSGVLFAVVSLNSAPWVGKTFPGFFVMANRVIPSIALPDWFASSPSGLFQHEVAAVDGAPVSSAAEVYARVGAPPPGRPIRYTLRGADGVVSTEELPSRSFSGLDYVLVFGSYLVCGAAFIIAGLLVFLLKPHGAASAGLLSAGLAIGVFALTAADLYGPHWFFRLHVLAECFASAGLMHLALVFPTDRIRAHRVAALAAVYVPFAILAAVYEVVLLQPSAYSTVHLLASVGHGIAGFAIILAVTYDLLTTRSALVRRRIGVVTLGTLVGFGVPTFVMAGSGLLGGSVAVNWAGLTAFVFPLSLGYAIVKQDLFEIDVMLRRALTYVVVVVTVTTAYLAALLFIGVLVPAGELVRQSPGTHAVLNLGLLFMIAPTRQWARDGVDRVFFRKGYDAELALSDLSRVLASARTVEGVIDDALRIVGETVCTAASAVWFRRFDGHFCLASGAGPSEFELPSDLAVRVERGEVLARYEWDDGSGRPIPPSWRSLDAEILIPLRDGDILIALLVLGPKGSGHAYSIHDVAFLRTLANQLVLAMSNALAFDQLEKLNAGLEQQVRERTAALESSNGELNRSLADLREAYRQLEQSQASLMRADRLATLGRLTAGIAHEINTPLGAVLNALNVVAGLGREYADSVGDPDVLPEDHREIAAEIIATAETAGAWAAKAAAFISRVKIHGREPGPAVAEPFAVRAVFEETCALLAHRLRAAVCRVDFAEEPRDVHLVGKPERLGQVLVNLVTNAIDAYEEAGAMDGRVEVRACRTEEGVTLTVRDWAGGIPSEALPRIFEELFTTKEPGRGTGLGLWIARNLVEETFGGTLAVAVTSGVGSCFTATFPACAGSQDVASSAGSEPHCAVG